MWARPTDLRVAKPKLCHCATEATIRNRWNNDFKLVGYKKVSELIKKPKILQKTGVKIEIAFFSTLLR